MNNAKPQKTPYIDTGHDTWCNDCNNRYCTCLNRLVDADPTTVVIPAINESKMMRVLAKIWKKEK